MLKRLATWE